MGKVLVSTISNGVNKFKGKGIFNKNELVFYENKIKTKIIIKKDKLIIEREADYFLHLEFEENKKTEGYINNFGKVILDIFTSKLIIRKDSIYIKYNIFEDFTYFVSFTNIL